MVLVRAVHGVGGDGMSAYGIAIFDQHAEMLAASAVAPEVARERGYRSVDTKKNLQGRGFAPAQRRVPGLLIPIFGPTGTEPVSYQYRPDDPRSGEDDRAIKYETPAGSRVVLDVPPRVRQQLVDATVPLWITEGAKKADAAVSAGLCCVSLSGVWCWRCKRDDGTRGPLPEWDDVVLQDRKVFVCFDNDVTTKPEVRKALDALAEFLAGRGATVFVVLLPNDGAKVGLDDFLATGGTAADLEVLAIEMDVTPRHYRRTDVGNAQRLVDQFGDRFRHVPEIGYLAWTGTRWERDTAGQIFEAAKAVAQSIWDEAAEADTTEKKSELVKWAIQSEHSARIEAMARMARTDPKITVTIDELDADPYLLNTPTGTVDLRTGTVRAHDPADLITKVTGCGYDRDAASPTWDEFLRRITRGRAELVDYLRKLIGYSLTGATLEHVLVIFFGGGANGKSTFLNTVLETAGEYGGTAEPDLLITRRHDAHPTGIADLRGRRIVVAMETGRGRRLDEAVVKRLTGGDPIKARVMRGDFFEFTPSHTLIMATNDRPKVGDTTDGIWRRLKLVPFDVSIAPQDQDHDLPAKLRAELPGILAWAVRGCLEYQAEGLSAPAAVALATTDYRTEQNVVGRWLEDYLDDDRRRSGGWFLAADLFAHFKIWCEQEGERPGTQTAFGAELNRRGFISDRKNIDGRRGRAWDLPQYENVRRDALDTSSGSPPDHAFAGADTETASQRVPTRPSAGECDQCGAWSPRRIPLEDTGMELCPGCTHAMYPEDAS